MLAALGKYVFEILNTLFQVAIRIKQHHMRTTMRSLEKHSTDIGAGVHFKKADPQTWGFLRLCNRIKINRLLSNRFPAKPV
jgi:hypothetical protein